jgi:hypothetical protein
MSEVAVKKTIKKPVLKKTESVPEATVVPPVDDTTKATKAPKAPKAPKTEKVEKAVENAETSEAKVPKERTKKAPKASKAQKAVETVVVSENTVPATPVEPAEKGSKTTAKNIDVILRVLISHFNLDEKLVKNVLTDYLPLTSSFKKRRKAKKDPEAPKKAPSSFMEYNLEQRETVIKENPGIGFKDIAKKIGENWRNLSAEQKQVYIDRASVAKRQYEERDASYRVQKGLPAKVVKAPVVDAQVAQVVAVASS